MEDCYRVKKGTYVRVSIGSETCCKAMGHVAIPLRDMIDIVYTVHAVDVQQSTKYLRALCEERND